MPGLSNIFQSPIQNLKDIYVLTPLKSIQSQNSDPGWCQIQDPGWHLFKGQGIGEGEVGCLGQN